MVDSNVEIIHRILDGEKEAFSDLVQKHQKKVHAIAWKKIGDYHIAEEITQDTFIQVYKKLPTLKNPKQFDGWIYVITTRRCINWIQRNKTPIQSVEDTPVEEIDESFYIHYDSEQRKEKEAARNSAIVKKLLAKLPESDRTVMTLYYLGEMTAKEISKSLGVSLNTIKSKIRRARNRLKAEEEILITEHLEGVQLSTNLTESIMRQIADIKQTTPVAKPVLPWVAFGTAAMLIVLLLGAMNQYIAHFQMPYNFDALSEPTIDIVESPIHIDIISTPTKRNNIGKGVTNSKTEGAGTIVSNADFASNIQENAMNSSVVQWKQANGPEGSPKSNIFATKDNNIYAVSPTGIYRLTKGGTTWTNVNASVPISSFESPITEHRGVIYSVNTNEIFASTDGGEIWNKLCSRPKGEAIGLIIKDNTKESNSEENFIMYLALQNNGVFQTANAGKKWLPLNNGLTGKRIYAVASVGNAVFIGTNSGLYRLNIEVWEQLPVDPLKTVHSMTVFEKNLYVVIGHDYLSSDFLKRNSLDKKSRRIFHTIDLGSTWREITPKDKSFNKGVVFIGPTKLSAVDKTLLVLGIPGFRSLDGGQTWANLGINIDMLPSNNSSVLAVNETTYYKVGPPGIIRTTDRGDSWQPFTNGMVKTKVEDLVAFNNKLYVYTGIRFFESSDDGYSWKEVRIDYGEFIPKLTNNEDQPVIHFTNSKLIIANNVLYGIVPEGKEIYIFRLHTEDGVFSMVHKFYSPKLGTSGEDAKDSNSSDTNSLPKLGGIAVSSDTFYTEYKRVLFKWTLGSTEMIDTGLTDTEKQIKKGYDRGFKLASSAEVVYVGKRDGKLFQSIDSGYSWRDITSNIPSRFTHIKDITCVESTVYVATDKGVLTSQTGEDWRMLTDNIGTHIIIDKFATNGSNIFGAGDMGVYRLVSKRNWEQIIPSIPGKVISLSANHDKLYIGTEKRGIFHTSLKDESSEETVAATRRTIK